MATEDRQNFLRDEALALLQGFTARILPGILRRIGGWKGIPTAALRELGEDITQELTLDCLEDPAAIVKGPTEVRHARWIRRAERWVYHQHVRPHRRGATADPDTIAAPAQRTRSDQVGEAPPVGIVQLKNGRCNLHASAERSGSSIRAVRRQLDHLANRLRETTPLLFWQRRLAEALVGLGADLLRLCYPLHLLPTGRPCPDPAARRRRIRRLASRFPLHRTPLEVRKILACWNRPANRAAATARRALQQATRLCPERPEGWLWLFEAAVVDGDFATAARTLRTCRRWARPNAGRVVLARARLLEVRGNLPAAVALLARAYRRWPHEARLRRAWRTGTGHCSITD